MADLATCASKPGVCTTSAFIVNKQLGPALNVFDRGWHDWLQIGSPCMKLSARESLSGSSSALLLTARTASGCTAHTGGSHACLLPSKCTALPCSSWHSSNAVVGTKPRHSWRLHTLCAPAAAAGLPGEHQRLQGAAGQARVPRPGGPVARPAHAHQVGHHQVRAQVGRRAARPQVQGPEIPHMDGPWRLLALALW